MAAFSHSRIGSRANNGGSSSTLAGQQLPSGCCNFRDLRPGASLTSCGCKRFWLNLDHYAGQNTDRAWCFCGHHACFHDAFSQQRQEASMGVNRMSGGDINGQAEIEYNQPPPGYVPAQQRTSQTTPKHLTGLGIQPNSTSQSQSINTRVFEALNGFARQQEDGGYSDIPSTTAPSVADEPRFSPGYHGPQGQGQNPMGPPINVPPSGMMRPSAEELSATEVNTPSIAGTPDFRATASSSNQTRPSPGHLPPGRFVTGPRKNSRVSPQAPNARSSAQPVDERKESQTNTTPSLLEMQNLIKSYGQRLDLLESMSFSHVPVEELQDRFEHFDGRLLDLEHWRADRDREQTSPQPAEPSSSKRRRVMEPEIGSFSSDVSFDSNAAAHTEAVVMATLATNAITDPRIEALENRVTDLENAGPPSFARPWQVQVVLLPWGRPLRGIWFSSVEATQRSMRASTQDEWSGAQSMPKLSFKSSDSAAWTTESIQAWANEAQDWLSPKACGPSGTVFQRLASRGLVQDITLNAPDSRHILSALRKAFEDVYPRPDATAEAAGQHQALSEDFIPLRKVRKSSRLRFLRPSEMVTAATWDAEFLDSSVFMKVGEGQRRLYVTTPEAYLQSLEIGWTWSGIRQLPIFDASAGEQAAQATGTAIEACWSYNENLDQAASTPSSFAPQTSPWTVETPDLHDVDDTDAAAMSTHTNDHPHHHHHRTVSLPSSSVAASAIQADLPKRRVASFETGGIAPMPTDSHGLEVQAKRRRISLSPEAERRGVNFTPRWSREPPSPFTSDAARSQGASSRNKRGATPFAYATPHSNNQYVGRMECLGGGDGDTEADTDLAGEGSERAEEEWEGVGDDGPDVGMTDKADLMGGDEDEEVDERGLDEAFVLAGA